MHTRSAVLMAGVVVVALGVLPAFAQRSATEEEANANGRPDYGLGKTPTPQQIAGWDIDASRPDGSGLPPGSGSVSQGKQVYGQHCVSCHGPNGSGPMAKLVGGRGSLSTDHPVKTVGSYWPYATTLWDYINRAMPLTSPRSLTHDQVYAVTAYVLHLNQIVPKDAVMNATSLPKVQMPNANGFTEACTAWAGLSRPVGTPSASREECDPRPDVTNTACMKNCSELKAQTSDSAPR